MKAVSAQAVSYCVYVKPPKWIMQYMRGIIPYMFDCWAHSVAHLLLPKSSVHNLSAEFILASNLEHFHSN